MTKIVELIYTDTDMVGTGKANDPYRRLYQWFEKDGTLVFQIDPCEGIEAKDK